MLSFILMIFKCDNSNKLIVVNVNVINVNHISQLVSSIFESRIFFLI